MCNGGMIINKLPPCTHEAKFIYGNPMQGGDLIFMGFGAFWSFHINTDTNMSPHPYILILTVFLELSDFQQVMELENSYLT
jgi:hypothetical protein